MVLRLRDSKMASEQPVKKKLRRDESETSDEPDFIRMPENGVTDLSALHLSLPATVNEDEITLNTVNQVHLGKPPLYRTSDEVREINDTSNGNVAQYSGSRIGASVSYSNSVHPVYVANSENISIKPAPDIIASNQVVPHCVATVLSSHSISVLETNVNSNSSPISTNNIRVTNHDRCIPVQLISKSESIASEEISEGTECNRDIDDFQSNLIRQCLCNVSELAIHRSFYVESLQGDASNLMLEEWPACKVLQFLSNLQLLFDVYLKQNSRGYICSQIVSLCENLAHNEFHMIEEIIALCETGNKYINYLTPKVLSSFLIVSKTNINNELLESIVSFLVVENINYIKMNFALEVIKRVVEWKDVETHILEESQSQDAASSSSSSIDVNVDCITVPFSDSESFDTSAVKGIVIKSLESKWPDLISKIHYLISNNSSSPQAQNCIQTFLTLWESIISVKANLSVIDTKPFYANLEKFVIILHNNLSPLIWKQLLTLFNEVLCYGSTLALQDMLPNDICQLAHLLVRYVKDFRLLDSLPYRRNEGFTVNSFIGTIPSTSPSHSNIDKTLLQKMVLLVLKSVAITVKETRSDSSDSSVGSDDYDYFQDMQVIERSIRDVLKKLDTFIKSGLDFHPETPFCKVLVQLFSDQDDYMIEAMVCTLDITVGISYRNSVYPDLLVMLNPVHSFIEFLKVVSHHSDVLLDYLVSNETCFLLYLLRFLKYIKKNWDKFLTSCSEGANELDSTMTVLIRLKMQISRLVARDLFPYNINPVLRLLEICESLYEGNEYS